MGTIFCYDCGEDVEITSTMACKCGDVLARGEFGEIGMKPKDDNATLGLDVWFPDNCLLIGREGTRAYAGDDVYLLIDTES